jgi:peptide/nickel transport system permease protein
MLVVWPSLALLLTVLSFNLLGENLRSRWSGR